MIYPDNSKIMPSNYYGKVDSQNIYVICNYLMAGSENICKNAWKIYGGGVNL